MADYSIENDFLKIGINKHGAELVSLQKKSDGVEYMWNGDSKFWGRVSPVLFPFVGKLKDKSYSYKNVIYKDIPQHGFARDSEFAMCEKTDDVIWFELIKDENWKKNYPFDFSLRIGYRLEGCKVHVMWTVINCGKENLYFSIGAHPAFICDAFKANEENPLGGYKLDFHVTESTLQAGKLSSEGLILEEKRNIELKDGVIDLSNKLFDDDALVFDSKKINTVTLLKNEEKILQLQFDAPQLGIWSPAGKKAPFVCIEPWFGRADTINFMGTLDKREYGNELVAGNSFNKEYVIEILN